MSFEKDIFIIASLSYKDQKYFQIVTPCNLNNKKVVSQNFSKINPFAQGTVHKKKEIPTTKIYF